MEYFMSNKNLQQNRARQTRQSVKRVMDAIEFRAPDRLPRWDNFLWVKVGEKSLQANGESLKDSLEMFCR